MHLCMNWSAIDFDWNHARAFLAVCEEGSLSAAARALGQTQPTIGRQISAFEAQLSITLFERSGHKLMLTDAGQKLHAHMQDMANAAARISLSASSQSQTVTGRVRITASDIFASHFLVPAVRELRQMAPGLELEVVATNDFSDLLHREADIALRHARPSEPDLIARLIHDAKADFYASLNYLDKRGRPNTIADMCQHDFISLGDVPEMLGYLNPFGLGLSADNFRAGSSNGLIAWEMARQGLGILVMSRDVGRASDGIEQVLPDHPPFTFPVWLVTHREVHTAKRIRLVYDYLAERLPRLMA